MNMKKNTVASAFVIFALVLLSMGSSYAFFNLATNTNSEQQEKIGNVSLSLENSTIENGLLVSNLNPLNDFEGRSINYNYVDFSVGGSATGNLPINYSIVISFYDQNNILLEDIKDLKVYLTEKTDDTLEVDTKLTLINNEVRTYSQLKLLDMKNNNQRLIYNGEVPIGLNGYKKDFRLRVWVKENPTDINIYNQQVIAKIKVIANNE
ncbi:MAG: hypothetical protein PHQ64_02005 [Bacilli bacterium]|nr:hypothetical protein [Bacilli bacterium]